MAFQYLDKKNQAYEQLDISVDQKAAKLVLDKVGQIVTPVIDIDGTYIIGFDREKIDAALKKRQKS